MEISNYVRDISSGFVSLVMFVVLMSIPYYPSTLAETVAVLASIVFLADAIVKFSIHDHDIRHTVSVAYSFAMAALLITIPQFGYPLSAMLGILFIMDGTAKLYYVRTKSALVLRHGLSFIVTVLLGLLLFWSIRIGGHIWPSMILGYLVLLDAGIKYYYLKEIL